VASSDVYISDGRDEPTPLFPSVFSFLRTFTGLRCAAGENTELSVVAPDRDGGLHAVDPSCDGPKYDTGLSKPEVSLLNLTDGTILGS
jgi:hypothetical protein